MDSNAGEQLRGQLAAAEEQLADASEAAAAARAEEAEATAAKEAAWSAEPPLTDEQVVARPRASGRFGPAREHREAAEAKEAEARAEVERLRAEVAKLDDA